MTNSSVYDHRLAQVRAWMRESAVDVLFVSTTDEFLSEYTGPYTQRLKWLNGFTGSMGEALITQSKALMFVDGRYVEHAAKEIPAQYDVIPTAEQTLAQWLQANLEPGQSVGVYPWIVSVERGKYLKTLIEGRQGQLTLLEKHPIDAFWEDRPAEPVGPVVVHPLTYAGQPYQEKIEALRQMMKDKNLDAYVFVNGNAICWLLNIRGVDNPETPIINAYLVMHAEGTGTLFMSPRPEMTAVLDHLKGRITLEPLDQLLPSLKQCKGRVALDSLESPYAIGLGLEAAGCQTLPLDDLTAMPRATKNPVEVAGARKAHQEDGLALIRTYHWIEQQMVAQGQNPICEYDISLKMLEERSKSSSFRMPSFATIAGFGPHSAMMHYHATEEGSAPLVGDGFLLIDSGGQYLGGTTDVTRTFAFGKIRDDQRDAYTRVLKGHIQLARAVFPRGTRGWQLDVLARGSLWEAGLDFAHATGHGVGSYLSVHENPMYIGGSSRFQYGFEVGMICSNEPGYYVAGDYGIRIESLMEVVEFAVSSQARTMLAFKILTRAPICLSMVMKELLSQEEIAWLNDYHAQVWADLSPLLSSEEVALKAWLKEACASI
jgi:Xaa-Pro aminopeptidase